MIKNALSFIKNQLEQHLALEFDLDESAAVINSLVNLDGAALPVNNNKVVISLINLQQEPTSTSSTATRSLRGEGFTQINPRQYFSIDLLFTANFDDYTEALQFLDATIRFFYTKAMFDKSNSPDMPEGLIKLNLEIQNSSYMDAHNLWHAMGARYQPSVIYKLRHLSIEAENINDVQTKIAVQSAKTS